MHTGPTACAHSCVIWMSWTLCVCCMVVIWPGFLGEYVLSRDCLRRMGRGNVTGARGRETGKQEFLLLLTCPMHACSGLMFAGRL